MKFRIDATDCNTISEMREGIKEFEELGNAYPSDFEFDINPVLFKAIVGNYVLYPGSLRFQDIGIRVVDRIEKDEVKKAAIEFLSPLMDLPVNRILLVDFYKELKLNE